MRRRRLHPLDRLARGVRQQVAATDRTDATREPRARLRLREAVDAILDEGEDAVEFFLGPLEVVRGQHPERDDGDLELIAPLDEPLDRVGAAAMAFGYGAHPREAGEPAVAVREDADVLRERTAPDVRLQASLVPRVDESSEHAVFSRTRSGVSCRDSGHNPQARRACRAPRQRGGHPRRTPPPPRTAAPCCVPRR